MGYLGPSLRRKRTTSDRWQRLLLALLVALAWNGAILRLVGSGWSFGKPGLRTEVKLAPLSASQWASNRAVGGTPSAPSTPTPAIPVPLVPLPAAPKPPEPPRNMPGQVVDVAPSKDHTPPKDSKFVSDQNNSVEKETKSRYAKAGYANTLPKPSEPKAPETQSKAGGQSGDEGTVAFATGADERDRKAGARSPAGFKLRVPDQEAEEKLALHFDPFGDLRTREARQAIHGNASRLDVNASPGEPAPQEGGAARAGKRGPRDQVNLMPTAATWDRLSGGPAPDHLDVEEGEGTYLNTREWKYATYFNRIKQAVAMSWDPNAALRIRDPNGSMFAYKDRITVVGVTLDQVGGLKDIFVDRTCGVDFLDRSAIDAFKKAQPFVNPPKGLADPNGEIKFTFGFYLEVGHTGLRLFRPAQ